jgi:hypothetical protein
MAEQPVTVFTPPRNPPVNPQPAVPEHRSTPVRDARVVDGVRSDPLMSEPQKRWRADFDEITRSDPWKDPNVIISKDADGTLRVRPRNDQQTSGAPAAQPGQPQPGQPPQPQPQPAATSDGTKLRIGELELTEADVRGLLERKSLEDGRRALVPTEPALTTSSCQATFRCPPGWSGVGT